MKFVLYGGGEAGRLAASHILATSAASAFAGLVWDEATGEAPQGVPVAAEGGGGPDSVLLCSGFGRIIKPEILARYGGGAFNAHPSLLPDYRGRHAIQWAVARGETVFGVTVHRMCADIDVGEHVMMRSRRFGLDQDYPQIASGLATMAARMLADLAVDLLAGRPLEALPQDPRANRYFRRRNPDDGRIDWGRTSAEVIGCVRAGGPGYFSSARRTDGESVAFTGKLVGSRPGEVLISTPEGVLVATGDGVVWLIPDRPLQVGEILV